MKEPLEQRVLRAKSSAAEAEALLQEYLPFVKKQAAQAAGTKAGELLTEAMLAFLAAVRGYEEARGGFLAFAGVVIRNRLTDALRRESRHAARVVPLFPEEEGQNREGQLSLGQYAREQERQALAEEIEAFSAALSRYGIAFGELPAASPRQERSRRLCAALAGTLAQTPALRDKLIRSGRLPQAELAAAHHVSVKTVEKHRKYIVTLAVLMLGEYPGMHAFLPQAGEVHTWAK